MRTHFATAVSRGTAVVAGLVLGASLAGCSSKSARLDGHFIGAADEKIYLERVTPGATSTLDSVTTDDKGRFGFRIALADRQPTIFNLRYADQLVPLLVSPGERVNVMTMGDVQRSYRVSGSAESELVARLHRILTDGMASLDSISTLWAATTPEGGGRDELSRAYLNEYYRIKRAHIRFIVENSSHLAAIYALYQRLPGDNVLFNGDTDFVYYQMVADSVQRLYPDSRYLAALNREIDAQKNRLSLRDAIAGATVSELDYPDIELPNIYGQKVKLSSLAGKVIVLDFWSASTVEGRLNNAELRELYNKYADRGLVIYQVSLDTSKPLWVNAVQEQKLPWITVCDFRGEASVAARLYNITSLPADFIIDRAGSIAGKNLYGERLATKVVALLGPEK